MRLAVAVVTISLSFAPLFAQTSYYVDPQGSDNNDGLSPARAWRTLAKVSQWGFKPGDKVMLRRGAQWSGDGLSLSISGTAQAPVMIGCYGDGPDPVITARTTPPRLVQFG